MTLQPLASPPRTAHIDLYFPDAVCDEDCETWWIRRDLAAQATEIVRGFQLEGHLVFEGEVVVVPGPDPFSGEPGGLWEADPAVEHEEAAVYARFTDEPHELADFDAEVCSVCGEDA